VEKNTRNLTRSQMAERREEAIRLLQAGDMRQAQIARYLGVSEAAVSKWNKKLEEDGPHSLELRKAPGRPPKLAKDEKQRLLDKLEGGTAAAGFGDGVWELEKVDEMLQQEFGVNYHSHYIYDLLKGLPWKLPRKRKRYFSQSLSYDIQKQELRIQYENKINRRKKDVTILFDLSVWEEIIEVVIRYFKAQEQPYDPMREDAPIWWPTFLPTEEPCQVGPGGLVYRYTCLYAKTEAQLARVLTTHPKFLSRNPILVLQKITRS